MIDIKFSIFIGILVGALMILLGILFSKKPCEYGTGNGIRTPHSLKSKENWDYAQKNGPKIMVEHGIIGILLTMLVILFTILTGLSSNVCFGLSALISVGGFILCMIRIDVMVSRFGKSEKK